MVAGNKKREAMLFGYTNGKNFHWSKQVAVRNLLKQ
jgi:hypothetical protein